MSEDSISSTSASGATSDLGRGTTQSGGRVYNERLVLTMLRQEGGLPKAEIARRTGLSAQTISVIVRQLEADRLVSKGKPQRGRVGQPWVPFSLRPSGAYSIGLKVGRRSCDLLLMDFVGSVVKSLHQTYAYPTTGAVLKFVRDGMKQISTSLPKSDRDRICGVGIAIPFELWNWGKEIGAPPDVLQAWQSFDIKKMVAAETGLPTYLRNDATAACAAELAFGNPARFDDFLYLYIGLFIGGGVVMNGNLVTGPTGNAGALGPMPVIRIDAQGNHFSEQLIKSASIYSLEKQMIDKGFDASVIWDAPDDWRGLGDTLDHWINDTADSLAYAIASAVSIIDFSAVIIDGAFPRDVRTAIIEATAEKFTRIDRQGLSPLNIVEGTLGSTARALGGAAIPLLVNFTRDREILFNEAV